MRNRWTLVCLLGLVVVAGFGLKRVRFDTDILSVLPGEMPEVKGMKAFHEVFSRDEELVLLMEGGEDMARMAEDLAKRLEDAGVTERARWQPRWRENPEGLAELVGWLWLNGDEEEARGLAESLSEEKVEGTLAAAMERVATSLDGGEMMLSANDPFGFLGHSSMRALFDASEHGGEGFESGDGEAHLLFIEGPGGMEGYKESAEWIAEVKAVAEPWAAEQGLDLMWTGEPAFEAEIGSAMEKDMRGTVGITSVLIGLLFLAMQRRVSLLAGLGVVIGLVFLTALGLAGWIYGELSLMAAGFAAILIGLAVDYGVLICQEAKLAGHDEEAIRRATAKSIGWAAATTAAVFFALNLSGLPGISQLGTIVGLGVIAGAVLMLGLYVPWVAKAGAGRPEIAHKAAWVPGRRKALAGLGGLAVLALGMLAWKGFPGVEFDNRLMRPRDSPAMAAFERIQEKYPAWGSPALKLVIEGATDDEVRERMAEAGRRLEALMKERPELIRRFEVPQGWWPDPERMEGTAGILGQLSEERGRLLAAADEAGFSEEGSGLGRAVLERLPGVMERKRGVLPDEPAAAEILRGYVAKEAAGGRLLGTVELAGELEDGDFEALRTISGEGIYLAGWALLKPAVLPLVRRELVEIFLPMVGLMVVMLSLVFRRALDVGMALGMMAVSGLVLLAAMSGLGISWNFLNIAATPLLLGTGLDYSIHVLLAMRRTGGDLQAVWNGTGKAVVFCGCSTAIGFGSLCFASNDALASLGMVAVLGILISMVVAVVILPGVRGGRAGDRSHEEGRTTSRNT